MGAAAGKPSEPDPPTSWSDPVKNISIRNKPTRHPPSSNSTYARQHGVVRIAPRAERVERAERTERAERAPRQRIIENDYRARLRGLLDDKFRASMVYDNVSSPLAQRWREHKANRTLVRDSLDPSTYSCHNGSKRRFEDIPVSAMWREPVSFCSERKTTANPDIWTRKPICKDLEAREAKQKQRDFLDDLLAEHEEEEKKKAAQKAAENTTPSLLDLDLDKPPVNERKVAPQDSKPEWDFSTQITYKRPIPNRSVSPRLMQRTMSDPLRKPGSTLQRNGGRTTDVSSRLIPRTNSDPVDAKPQKPASRRPATPFVSGTLANQRPLNDYILDRRRNGLSCRNSSMSAVQNRLRTITDIDEQPPPRNRSPTTVDINATIAKYIKD